MNISKEKSSKGGKSRDERSNSVRKVLAKKPEFKQATYPSMARSPVPNNLAPNTRQGGRFEQKSSPSAKQNFDSINKESVLTFKGDHPVASRWNAEEKNHPREESDRIGKKFFDGTLDIPSNFGEYLGTPVEADIAHTGYFSGPVSVPTLSPIPYKSGNFHEHHSKPTDVQTDVPKNRFVQSKVMDPDSSKTPSKASVRGIEHDSSARRSRSTSNIKNRTNPVNWVDRHQPDWKKKPADDNRMERSKSGRTLAQPNTTRNQWKAPDKSLSPLSKNRLKIAPIEPEKYNRLLKKSDLAASGVIPMPEDHNNHPDTEENPTFHPEINKKSQLLADHLTRGNYSNVHERLFHKGVESIHRKQVEHQRLDRDRYPFRPLTNNPSPKNCLTREDIERFTSTTTTCKLEVPVASTPAPRKTSAPKHKYTLAEVEEFRKQQKVYRSYLLQVFDFLDYKHTGLLHPSTLRTELIESTLREMLAPIIDMVNKQKKFLDFPAFCGSVEQHDLSHIVYKTFGFVDAFPGVKHMHPVKKQEFKFK